MFRRQVLRFLGHGLGEMVPHRRYSLIGEGGIVAQEEAQLVIQIHEAVVDRGGGQQHQLLGWGALQQTPQRLGALGARVAQVMGLVHHHHGIFVGVRIQSDVGGIGVKPPVQPKVFVGDQLHGQHELGSKRSPGAVFQGGGCHHQDPLAIVQGRLFDQRPRQEGLAQAHLIGDQYPVPFGQDSLGPPHAVGLEAG